MIPKKNTILLCGLEGRKGNDGEEGMGSHFADMAMCLKGTHKEKI